MTAPGEDRASVGREHASHRLRLGVLVAVMTLCATGTAGVAIAASSARMRHVVTASAPRRKADPATNPGICSGCEPPLVYQGGPVLSTTTGGGLTVTPIFWEPSGGQYAFPPDYETTIDQFIANVAAASGSTDSVFSVVTEYYGTVGGANSQVKYAVQAGTALVVTDPFPSNGCTPASGYTACITDDQLRAELAAVTSNQNLPTDLAHFYPVFFPPGVETQDRDGTNSVDTYCGYHRAFGSGANVTVYANEPYEESGCDGGQAPNGSLAVDGELSTLSHELNEAITDPLQSTYAWSDKPGHEIGDLCANNYGPPLGSTDSSNPSGTEYNQVINGGKYYLQEEYSNLAYTKLGIDQGCVLSETAAQQASASGAQAATTQTANTQATATVQGGSTKTKPVTVVLDATPTALPADGKSTTSVTINVSDAQGNVIQGDRVHFALALQSGTGQCGTLSSTEKTTDAGGFATVTYTASRANVACWVLAVEAKRGHSSDALIYQGTAQKNAQTFNASYPTTLQAGGTARTFTITAANPATHPVPAARVTFDIWPGDGTTQYIDANQIHLSYSTTGPNGPFTTVPLTGSTSEGVIEGIVGPQQGTTLPAASTETFTFHVTLASNVPLSKTKPLVAFEAYLDQIDNASGSAATLGDTYAYQIKVPTATAAASNTVRNVLIAVAIALVLLAIGAVILWRRHQTPPQTPPTEAASP